MTDVNPYRPPGTAESRVAAVPGTPGVWYGYVAYCVLMALMYGALAAGGIVLGALLPASEVSESEPIVVVALMAGLGLLFFVPYAAAPFLPKRPWTWILGIVLIGFGLTSCLTLPFCIPLLLFWFKPENQAFFGKAPRSQ